MRLEHTDTTRLFNYILYERPADYPGYYVLRKTFCVKGKITVWLSHPRAVMLAKDVQLIHKLMRDRGFYWLVRSPEDDPVIMGVYV